MERFLSGATRLLLLGVLIVFFGITVGLPFLFSSPLPERWEFDNLPRWVQVPAVILALLYLAFEIWGLLHHTPQKKKDTSGPPRKF